MVSLLEEQNAMCLRHGNACRFLALRRRALERSGSIAVMNGVSSGQLFASHSQHGERSMHNASGYPYTVEAYRADGGSRSPGAVHRSPSLASAVAQHHSSVLLHQQHHQHRADASVASSRSTSEAHPAVLDLDGVRLPAPGEVRLDFERATDPERPQKPVRLVPCGVCHRNFDATRIERHVTACKKAAEKAKRRTAFDMQEVRVQGLYENDPSAADHVLRNLADDGEPSPRTHRGGGAPAKGSKWRQQSAAFQAIARGEPVPAAADTRVPCPGCGRRFAEDAAEKHIPRCVEKNRVGSRFR